MAPNNLIQQLGELNAHLSHVIPALERLETRLIEIGRELTETETNLANTTRELREHKDSNGEQIAILSSEIRTATQMNSDQSRDIVVLKDLAADKKKHGWEIGMVVATGILTALLTWLVSKLTGKGP
jgi:septal ring factor EnvC (AmiA/AmiB activator)